MIGSSGLKILPVDNLDEAARYNFIFTSSISTSLLFPGYPANYRRLLQLPEMPIWMLNLKCQSKFLVEHWWSLNISLTIVISVLMCSEIFHNYFMTFLSIEENLEIGKYKYAIHSLCLLSETVAVYSFTPSQWSSDPENIFKYRKYDISSFPAAASEPGQTDWLTNWSYMSSCGGNSRS